ncbi:MAG: nucleotidyltransferase family protein [Nitrospinae bacterium]|nr:nucleotidyltransferase family protein [Nitrospinota bacterium]
MTQKQKNYRTLFIESKDAPVKRDEVLKILRAHKATLAERFDVAELALFGSFARDEAAEDSDVDILVRFEGRPTSKGYFGAQFYIEDLLGRPVDLATDKELRPEIRPYVEREIVHV